MRYYLSQSALQSFERCPRKYYYQYIMKFDGISTFKAALDFGISIHNIIEKAYEIPEVDREEIMTNMIHDKVIEVDGDDTKDYEARLMKLVKPLTKIIVEYDATETELYVKEKVFDPKELSLETIEMIIRIQERRGKDTEGFEGVWFGGFIDALATDDDGDDIVIDWKTGKFSRFWVRPYERQIQLYSHLCRLEGRSVDIAKIIYVENNYEHEVDVRPQIIEPIFDKVIDAFRKILSLGEKIERFKKIDTLSECNGCNYDFVCHI